MKKIDDWGKAVKKALIERDLTMADLSRAIQATNAQYIRDTINGEVPGKKYKAKINQFLGLDK